MRLSATAVPNLREDVQALRGLAVLMVVLYHYHLGPFESGYIGVDIFFVISGFLVTQMILRAKSNGAFSLRQFYARRARRLLPASTATLILCSIAAPFILDGMQLAQYWQQLLGALTFSANFVLWGQTGYFAGASGLKPLLHIWSLSIEEQYYFFLPILILFVQRRRWPVAAVTLTAVSMALFVIATLKWSSAAFYLLPFRAWELGIGTCAAIYSSRTSLFGSTPSINSWLNYLKISALACILLLSFLPTLGMHRIVATFLVCVMTVFVLLLPTRPSGAVLLWPLARLGDISYSWYLLHWPAIAFLNVAWIGESLPPLSWRVALLFTSLMAACFMYFWVETPFRYKTTGTGWLVARRGRTLTWLGIPYIFLLMTAAGLWLIVPSSTAGISLRVHNTGLHESCESSGVFKPTAACMTGPNPVVLLWGDSFAMHLAAGVSAAFAGEGLVQATKSVCGPLHEISPLRKENPPEGLRYSPEWAQQCNEFNLSVLKYLARTSSIKWVVLSSPLSQYISKDWAHIEGDHFEGIAKENSPLTAAKHLVQTVRTLESMGKSVAFVTPPPSEGFDVGACLFRRAAGLPILGSASDCRIVRRDYERHKKDVLEAVGLIREQGVNVINLDSVLCDELVCRTQLDGLPLYVDDGHITPFASVWLARTMDWRKKVVQFGTSK